MYTHLKKWNPFFLKRIYFEFVYFIRLRKLSAVMHTSENGSWRVTKGYVSQATTIYLDLIILYIAGGRWQTLNNVLNNNNIMLSLALFVVVMQVSLLNK